METPNTAISAMISIHKLILHKRYMWMSPDLVRVSEIPPISVETFIEKLATCAKSVMTASRAEVRRDCRKADENNKGDL